MAGQPKKRALLAELQRRVNETYGDEAATHNALDYAEAWIASGHTLRELAEDIGVVVPELPVMYETLRRHLIALDPENGSARLTRARARGSYAMVEDAIDIADESENARNKLQVSSAKLRSDIRLRVAEMFNRAELGQKPTTAVNVSVGSLFVQALRARQPEITASVAAQLPGASAEDIPEADCEVITQANSLQDNDLA